jgi:hypothetical protein
MANSGVYDNPLTPEERLAEVLRDRALLKATAPPDRKGPPAPRGDRGWIDGAPATSTYFQEAGLADDEIGGRYAPRRGNDPVAYPAQPANSPWAAEFAVGIEPPLGEKVDALPCMISRDGDDQRGLTPWTYGPPPSEQHSSYDLDTSRGPLASGCTSPEVFPSLASGTAEPATQISVAGAGSVVPSLTARPPEVQPQLEPNDVSPNEETKT